MVGISKKGAVAVLASLYLAAPLHAASTPYDLDVNELDRKPSAAKEAPKAKKPKTPQAKKAIKPAAPPSTAARPAPTPAPAAKGTRRYKVQEGDYRLKTLAKHLHLSEENAEALLPEILRLNNLASLADLQLGSILLIPAEPAQEPSQPAATPGQTHAPELRQICSVTDKEPGHIVDAFLNALQLQWSRNRIIESGKGAQKAFSVRVDRFFTLKKIPHVITIEQSDPYSYTLLRVLESSGYRMVQISAADDFRTIGEKILALVGMKPTFGPQPIDATRQLPGFAVPQRSGKGRVIITDAPVDAELRGVLPAGCSVQ